MYGFVHCAWADMVISQCGEESWSRILEECGIELGGGTFLIHKHYTDEDTYKLMAATARVMGTDLPTCMENYGEHFFKYCMESGYDRVLRVLGNNLLDFLCNLDALHDHFDSAYPGMRAPSFRCNPTDSGGLLLHYYSERTGLYPMVIGVVKAVAKGLFSTNVIVEPLNRLGTREVTSLSVSDGKASRCVTLCIREENPLGLSTRKRSSSLVSSLTRYRNSTRPRDLPLSVRTFCKAFPFHVMFNRSLEIIQAGSSLLRILRTCVSPGTKLHFSDLFTVVRPIMDFGFNAVLGHINTIFVVITREKVSVDSNGRQRLCDNLHFANGSGTPVKASPINLRLKGQMVFVPESDAILFLCSPRVSNLDDMKSRGIFLSDIPVHDATRDLILITQARRHERELVEKLEETSNNLKKLQTRLQEDKQRTDELLHSILPSNVADKLRLNQPVEAEKFNLVSILFSDIVGFTAMCGDEKVVPIDIVRMLNRLYTQFDMLSSLNSVYKVETIGDAYMVVGGLPTPTESHADNVVSMAFGMIEVSRTVLSPVDGNSIQIRIGVHSGPCVAGVVGQKMPRYCLFGNSVTIASKMEACSRPGKINISEHAKSHLSHQECYSFEDNPANADSLGCKSYFISQTVSSPRPITMDLSLPVPKGMFRTPNPTPPGSRATTPGASPKDILSPVRTNSPDVPSLMNFQTPAIQISDSDEAIKRRISLEKVEEEIRRKLSTSANLDEFMSQEIQSPKTCCISPYLPSNKRSSIMPESLKYGSEGLTAGCPMKAERSLLHLQIPEVKLTVENGESKHTDTASAVVPSSDLPEKGIQEIEQMERRRKLSQDHKCSDYRTNNDVKNNKPVCVVEEPVTHQSHAETACKAICRKNPQIFIAPVEAEPRQDDCRDCNLLFNDQRSERPISPSLMSPPNVEDCLHQLRRKSDSAVYGSDKHSDLDGMKSVTSVSCISKGYMETKVLLVRDKQAKSTGFLNGTNISFSKKELADIRARSKLTIYFRTQNRTRSSSLPPSNPNW